MKITVYAHTFCPTVPLVIGILKQANVEYDYINIHSDDAARNLVREINNGYESVPTLVFPDGSTLTEPSERELAHKLQSLGYHVPFWTRIFAHLHWVIIGIGVLLAFIQSQI